MHPGLQIHTHTTTHTGCVSLCVHPIQLHKPSLQSIANIPMKRGEKIWWCSVSHQPFILHFFIYIIKKKKSNINFYIPWTYTLWENSSMISQTPNHFLITPHDNVKAKNGRRLRRKLEKEKLIKLQINETIIFKNCTPIFLNPFSLINMFMHMCKLAKAINAISNRFHFRHRSTQTHSLSSSDTIFTLVWHSHTLHITKKLLMGMTSLLWWLQYPPLSYMFITIYWEMSLFG